MGIADRSTASAFLLDQEGIVRLRGEGYAGEEAVRAMLAAARRLAGE